MTQYVSLQTPEQAIEEEGFRYGQKLNKNRCELITTHPNANIHFGDNTRVPHVRLATCLGCKIGIKITADKNFLKDLLTA